LSRRPRYRKQGRSLCKVRASDRLVLVVAFRYGWIPPGQKAKEKRSITRMEVEEAGRKGIPILPFFAAKEEGPLWELGERYRLSKAKTDDEFKDFSLRAQLLDKFKATFSGTDIGQFESPEDLLHKIYRALEPWVSRCSLIVEFSLFVFNKVHDFNAKI
jgi:hypothetical protein